MTAPSSFKFSLACGVAGAWTEVTSDVLFEDGNIPITEGRDTQFDVIPPGLGSFTLANPTGDYTPGNAATTLATPLSEGMGVCVELGGQLFSGTIRNVSVLFPAKELADTARVRVTWDDMLGNAARRELGSVSEIIANSAPYYWWPLDDPVGIVARSAVANAPDLETLVASATFGSTPVAGVETNQVVLTGSGADPILGWPNYVLGRTLSYASLTSLGTWGVWVTQLTAANGYLNVQAFAASAFQLGIEPNGSAGYSAYAAGVSVPTVAYGPAVRVGDPHYFSVDLTVSSVGTTRTLMLTPYLDGVAFSAPIASGSYVGDLTALQLSPTWVRLYGSDSGAVRFGQLTFTPAPVNLGTVNASTAVARLAAVAKWVSSITFDTLPTDLGTQPYGAESPDGSALDALNDVIRAEQGYMWVETGGTLLAPDPKIKIGARNRERAIDFTFDVSEILDPISFIHSLTNTVSTFTADGPTASATYEDASLVPLVAGANSSDPVPLRDYNDLYAYASDRVYRGINRGVIIQSITIDATSPNISRWADFDAIRQGHRIRITGLPVTQLGYSTWDGFVIGRDILNTQSETDEPKTFFTYNLAPWTPVSVLDTARLAAGGNLTLTSTITNSTTGLSITSSDGTLLSTTAGDYPLSFRLENEVVTAATQAVGATSPQTLTVTRGQTDPLTGLATTAAAHSAAVAFEVAEPAILAY